MQTKRRYVLLSALYLSTLAAAQPAPPATQPVKAKGPRVVQLSLSPAPAPRPALKYALLPDYLDQQPVNAEPLMYMTGQLTTQLAGKQEWDDFYRHVGDWNDLPVAQRPRDEVNALLAKATQALRYAHLAARHEYCHWYLPVKSEGFASELPNLGAYRLVSRLLSLRADAAIVDRKYAEALSDLQTGLGIARWCQGPTIINDLVSVSCMNLLARSVELWVSQPDAPNLFWALAQLRPFLDAREGYQMERGVLYCELPELRNLGATALTQAQADALIVKLVALRDRYKIKAGAEHWASTEAVQAFIKVREAKSRAALLSHGYSPDKLQAMPPAQVVVVDGLDQYEYWRDEECKWLNLPYWQSHKQVEQLSDRIATQLTQEAGQFFPFVEVIPALANAQSAIARADRNIAALQVIEAIRMNMAHAGKTGLPASLDDITVVPLPGDPVTGKPFLYQPTKTGAVLICPSPRPDRPEDETRYELKAGS